MTLMTIHWSKGLEFEHLYIVGLEEDILPSYHSLGDNELVEEERRLAYVALTRARKSLSITHAEKRFIYGTEFSCRQVISLMSSLSNMSSIAISQ